MKVKAIHTPMTPLAAAVAWARVHLREHTLAQVTAGGIVGACATGLLFPALL